MMERLKNGFSAIVNRVKSDKRRQMLLALATLGMILGVATYVKFIPEGFSGVAYFAIGMAYGYAERLSEEIHNNRVEDIDSDE